MNIVEWRDRVCETFYEAIRRAAPTGSANEPKAIAEFSVELLQELLDGAPTLEGMR